MRSIPPCGPCKSNWKWTTPTARSFPGAYAEVHFKLPASAKTLRLPANTVLFRAAGLQVATIDDRKRVKLKSVVQGRDFGNTIEILSGLEPNDMVVLNPPDSLIDGVSVRIALRLPPRRTEKAHMNASASERHSVAHGDTGRVLIRAPYQIPESAAPHRRL